MAEDMGWGLCNLFIGAYATGNLWYVSSVSFTEDHRTPKVMKLLAKFNLTLECGK